MFPLETATETATDTPTATPTPQGGIARYYYDGDGNMVKSVIDDITTYSPSAAYQVKTNGMYTNTRKYYSFNGAVVAMRENGVVTWLQQDQVNSTTITADANGNLLTETRYSAFGEIRYTNGITVTDKLYTLQKPPGQAGQQQETEIGLDYYIARFYDPVIGRFIQPDSLIPQASASASYDRYAYVNGNPVNFNDPSGHKYCDTADGDCDGGGGSSVGGNIDNVYILPIAGEDQNNNDSFLTITHTNGYIMGPNNLNKSVDYYSDYPNDPIIQTRNPVALIPPLIDWLTRFSNLLPPIEKDNNFFVTYEIAYDGGEYLTVENITITNYYSDHNVYLRNIRIINEYNSFPIIYKDIQLGHGFGSEYKVPAKSASNRTAIPEQIAQ